MKTSRRSFIRSVGGGAAASISGTAGAAGSGQRRATSQPPAVAATQSRPNILLIHTDEHRFDCLGAYGNTEIRTPRIDALAADGVSFSNSFCPFPVCTPSRYSLLSGRWVHQHRGWSNRSTLRPDIDTFPRILRNSGYRTKAVGKMHFTPTYLDVGFEEMELAEQDGPGRFDDDYHRYLRKLDLVDRIDIQDQRSEYRQKAPQQYWDTFGAQRSDLPEVHHSTTWIAERGLEALRNWSPSGNLLMVGFIKPHHPFDPPAPWDSLYDPDKTSLLAGWIDQPLPRDLELNAGYFPHSSLTAKALRRVTAFYYASISQIDFQIGRMVELLKSRGLYDSTLIVFTADHGDYLGFHHLLLKANHMYDPVVKVPLIVKFPGGASRGTRSGALVNTVDLAPTILRQAGCPRGQGMIGLDLAGTEFRPVVFAESAGQRMARTARFKLIVRQPVEKSLLFDLAHDPLEMENLYGKPEYRKEADDLTRAVDAWRGPGVEVRAYLDENAPLIRQPNVPPRDGSERQKMIEYFQRKMGFASP
jgi:arylsulfatase